MTMTFRARPQKGGMRSIVQTGAQGCHRFQKRLRDRGSPKIEQAQHARSIPAETVIAIEYMIERIVRHGGRQSGCYRDKGFEAVPA